MSANRVIQQLPTVLATAVATAVVVGSVVLASALRRAAAAISAQVEENRRMIRMLQTKTAYKKPRFIILIRHGESIGNIDSAEYTRTPDSEVQLTAEGKRQAMRAGDELKTLLGGSPVWSFCSPYKRTKQTADFCLNQLDKGQVLQHREDPRIRELEFKGTFQDEEIRSAIAERMEYGRFFFRFPNGESAADVYDRVSTFMDTLWRDFVSYDLSDTAVVIFTHGLTARVFLMRWFRWSPQEFIKTRNPDNCSLLVMERIADPFEPSRSTMRLRDDAREQLGIAPELCFTIRDRQVTNLELPP